MFKISENKIITVSRGDSFSLDVFVNLGYGCCPVQYIPKEGDKVYFGLMEPNQPFEFALIRKVFGENDVNPDNGLVHMEFKPEDTEYLLPGLYYYSVKLATPIYEDSEDSDEEIEPRYEVSTVIAKTKFYIID